MSSYETFTEEFQLDPLSFKARQRISCLWWLSNGILQVSSMVAQHWLQYTGCFQSSFPIVGQLKHSRWEVISSFRVCAFNFLVSYMQLQFEVQKKLALFVHSFYSIRLSSISFYFGQQLVLHFESLVSGNWLLASLLLVPSIVHEWNRQAREIVKLPLLLALRSSFCSMTRTNIDSQFWVLQRRISSAAAFSQKTTPKAFTAQSHLQSSKPGVWT